MTELTNTKRSNSLNLTEENIGPNPRKLRKSEYYDLVLDNIPLSESYQISYMHKDIITNILSSSETDTIITASIDGHIKLWRKVFLLIEPLKTFKAHNGQITGLSLSKNKDLLVSVGLDKMLRIFDLQSSELKISIKLNFVPVCCQFIPPRLNFDNPMVALGQEKSGRIIIVDYLGLQQVIVDKDEENVIVGEEVPIEETIKSKSIEQPSYIVEILNIHKHPIKFIRMNWIFNVCFSIDERAFLEIWNPSTLDFPTNLAFKIKLDTHFLELIQISSAPIAITLSPKGKYLAIMLKNRLIEIFNCFTGKKVVQINQSIKEITHIQEDPQHPWHSNYVVDNETFQKKISLQKDLEISKEHFSLPGLDFDESEEYLVYSSIIGIVFYSLAKKCPEKVTAKREHQRFIKCSLFQGKKMRNPSGMSTNDGQRRANDPLLLCTSFRRPRFYIFSRRQPQFQNNLPVLVRDIINERTNKQQNHNQVITKMSEVVGNQVVLQTTHGDITLYLYVEDCPKTCENFIKLAKKGYYNGHIFHRVIKGFMNQTGCPKGDGTGGESIWGGNFEDEIVAHKYRFEKPYVLAMANRGPNTNSSQFFITVVACPWLDTKHTIFGRVTRGIETVLDINKIKTDKTDKPLINVKIMSVKIL